MVIQERVVETGLAQLIVVGVLSSLRLLWESSERKPRLVPEARDPPGRSEALMPSAAMADTLRHEINRIVLLIIIQDIFTPFIVCL